MRWTPVVDGRHRSPSELGYAYRVVDPQAWQRWLDTISGRPGARLEVVTRRLRVVDEGPPAAAGGAPAAVSVPSPVAAPAPVTAPAAPTAPPVVTVPAAP